MALKTSGPDGEEITLAYPEAVEEFRRVYEETGNSFYVAIHEEDDARKTSWLYDCVNDAPSMQQIAKTYGPGRYRIYITQKADGSKTVKSTNFPVSISAKVRQPEAAGRTSGPRTFSIDDLRGMVGLLKEFSEVVLQHNPAGSHIQQPASIDMIKESSNMMLENMKIMNEQQRATNKVILEQSKMRDKARETDDEEGEEMDDDVIDGNAIPVVQLSAAEKLVDEVYSVMRGWIPDIMKGGPLAAGITAIAKKHPMFSQVIANPDALQALAATIWQDFGREELVGVVDALGLPSDLVEIAAALVSKVGDNG